MPDTTPLTDESEAILSELLTGGDSERDYSVRSKFAGQQPTTVVGAEPEDKTKKSLEAHSQWALGPDGKFMPVGSTTPSLPAGVYEPFSVPGMWGVEKLNINSDGIHLLPDMATQTVLDESKRFWESEERYRKHKLLYKRGVLLFGDPGGGKTVLIKLLIEALVKQGGIVLLVGNVNLAIVCLKAIRRIEPKRNLIIVLEDVDEIMQYNGESNLLALLDGENSIDNILMLASTNYPARLGPRIINRPSRFDRRIHIGMPTAAARKEYLKQATHGELGEDELVKWTKDTDQMSIAHLRELVAAVYCLAQPYGEVILRLQEMARAIKETDGFKKTSVGFGRKAMEDLTMPEDYSLTNGAGLNKVKES